MKIIKAMIGLNQNGNERKHIYPVGFNHSKVKWVTREPEADIIARDITDMYVIGVIQDSDMVEFLAFNDVIELTENDAVVTGTIWSPQREQLVDLNKVTIVLAKQARGETLTQVELDTIDPSKDEIGINMSRAFSDTLTEYLGTV